MNHTEPATTMYNPTGLDAKSLAFCLLTIMLNSVQQAPVWLDSTTKALASVAAISTITYNAIKMWMEVMGKQKPKTRKPLKNK